MFSIAAFIPNQTQMYFNKLNKSFHSILSAPLDVDNAAAPSYVNGR